jgi:hypothetical protein
MFGRRGYPRFVVSIGSGGLLQVQTSAVVQRTTGHQWFALALDSAAVGERLQLETGPEGECLRLAVSVTDSRPIIVNGSVRYALHLAAAGDAWKPPVAPSLEDSRAAVLTSEIEIRLLNISHSGCLLEADRRVKAGTFATMKTMVDFEAYTDQVRTTRCQQLAGAGATYRIAAQFVRTDLPSDDSLRRLVAGAEVYSDGVTMPRSLPN